MKRKNYIIFDSYNTFSEENMKSAKESLIENAFFNSDENGCITEIDNFGKNVILTKEDFEKSITEEMLYNECRFINELWFEDTLRELKRVSSGEVIAIGTIGTWQGRCSGYKELKSLENCMYSSCDSERLYVDSNGDLRKEESHHDGSNSILYRYWKDNITDTQRQNFLDKIYSGKVTSRDITKYTKKCGVDIANTYGWKVRK